MQTITRKVPVTLTPEEADQICNLLRAVSHNAWATAHRSKHAAVREFAETQGRQANNLEAAIVRRLYQTDITEEARRVSVSI